MKLIYVKQIAGLAFVLMYVLEKEKKINMYEDSAGIILYPPYHQTILPGVFDKNSSANLSLNKC